MHNSRLSKNERVIMGKLGFLLTLTKILMPIIIHSARKNKGVTDKIKTPPQINNI
jgi:hypothetical protein